ncbi:hypothetical protein AAFF_G00067510 [Aldrovandia affinis]|uniref:Peptidase M12B domain-containing protein n=1 Tax=Aldrovandia affinis TaxID=143900 RepID=A0AAD7RZ73_9TELE|nr:hypothetical protein AAFF_G00067510 [Aldrovandia affinis]
MSDSCVLQTLLFSLLFDAGLRAMTADGEHETDVVVPRALSGNRGHRLRDGFARGGSSRSSESKPPRSGDHGDRLFLMLPAFGTELYLNLRRDSGFLSEGSVIEERDERGTARLTHITDDRRCFYTGTVLNHTNSFASLSTCGGGLTGLVRTADLSVFVEPLAGGHGSFSGVEHRVVRQRPRPKSVSSASEWRPTSCQPVTAGRRRREAPGASGDQSNAVPLSADFTLETAIVLDADVVQFHGAQAAQRFILTVMNMVHNMFQHESLGVSLNVRLSKLLLLRNRPVRLKVEHHGERSLHSFCRWQRQEFGAAHYLGNKQVPGGWNSLPAVDVAVLITRTDFCVHKDEPCDTVGIAYLGGTCSSRRRCVLVEDNGLNLPFTIAHELGHSLGIRHDDDHASCSSHAHMMSGEWVKGRNPSNLSWSSCSRDDLEKFLRSGASACLLQTALHGHGDAPLSSKLPGMQYSADEQCQILFGSNASFCKDMEHLMCTGLWCLVERNASCQTNLDPPLDGTDCDTDKWCRAGLCVRKAPLPQHADGDWGLWGSWSSCSRTCGTGARFRQRKCDNPPPGPRGRRCQGGTVEQRVCQGPLCARGLPSFREQQCQSHAVRHTTAMWTAVTNDTKPCSLFCSPVGQDTPVLVAERVLDGTPCGPYETDLCVSGLCLRVGCDGLIGSAAEEDHCGVCGGDGQSCELVKGQFNQSTGNGYIEAVIIPVGASRIKVVENEPWHSFLALRDSSNGSINSDWKIQLPGEFELAGTTVRYVRRGLWEKMSAEGPTKIPLHLLVLLFHDQNSSIQYEYTLSLNSSLERDAVLQDHQQGEAEGRQEEEAGLLYVWAHSQWGDCTVQCGGGERKTVVSCSVVINGSLTVVNDSHCHLDNRPPPKTRRCNAHPCPSRWVAGEWGPCSLTCGAGLRVREVLCVSQLQNGSYTFTPDRSCPEPKPPPTQACQGPSCPARWDASDWTQCSSDCGRGTRKRLVSCSGSQDRCDSASRPPEEEPCEGHTHCNEWKTGDWSKCSSTCGRGHQSRIVQCMHKVTGRHGNDCPIYYKPPTSRQCNKSPCINNVNIDNSEAPRLGSFADGVVPVQRL